MNRVHLHALGCRLNEAELERWARAFEARGVAIASDPGLADVVVVNTCAVTREAARKSRNLIRRAQRRNPGAKLVVSGCYASLEPEAAAALDGVDLLIDNADKDRLVDLTLSSLDVGEMPALATEPGETALYHRGRSRAFVKVQDGCRHRCTFCIVTVARGAERSRPTLEIVEEVNALVHAGVREVVLTGVHVGGYGSDRDEDLVALLRTVLERTAVERLRLGSVEPWDLGEDFMDLFRDRRMMPHLHLPLQSGSDRMLKRMARRCRTADFERLVDDARARIPDLNLTTDVIAGFPGESEKDWREGLRFIERIGFGHVHVFPYSPRPGTAAAAMSHHVDAHTRRERVRTLQGLAAEMKRATLERHLGRAYPVLWERGGSHGVGYTPNYLRVRTEPGAGAVPENRIADVRLTALAGDGESVLGAP